MRYLPYTAAGLIPLFILALLFGPQPIPPTHAQASASLTVQPEVAPQNSSVTLTLAGFQPEESITLWLTLPNFATEAIGDYKASKTGDLVLEYRMAATRPQGQYAFSARGNLSGARATALFELTLGEGVPPDSNVSVTLESSSVLEQGDEFIFVGRGFESRERISLWINLPTQTIEDQGFVIADREGNFRFTLALDSAYPEGAYQLTAFGNRSELTGIVDFFLTRGQLPSFDLPVLFVNPSQVRQTETIRIEGQNFAGNERVSVWMTLNDGVVVQLQEVRTDQDGNFGFSLRLEATRFPAGRHQITAFGRNSLLVALALVEVLPGTGEN